MNSKNLIIGGTSGIGKSHLDDALIRKYIEENKKIRSLLHPMQTHTYGPLAVAEVMRTLAEEMNKRHPDRVYDALQWFVYCNEKYSSK